jgi:ferritin-like metal-binding protein YciE
MNIDNLRDAYVDQLKDVADAEKQLTEALPKMYDAATSPDLKRAIQEHLEITQQQLTRVRRLLEIDNINVGNKTCKAMKGLIEEGKEMLKADGDNDARDAAIIAAAKKLSITKLPPMARSKLGRIRLVWILRHRFCRKFLMRNTSRIKR